MKLRHALIALIVVALFAILPFWLPWNDWAQQIDAADRECMAVGFTKAQCDYLQAQP